MRGDAPPLDSLRGSKRAKSVRIHKTLGAEGVNRIWREAKIRAVRKKRVQTLVKAARHSAGRKEGTTTAHIEILMLLEDYESRNSRLQEVMTLIEELVSR